MTHLGIFILGLVPGSFVLSNPISSPPSRRRKTDQVTLPIPGSIHEEEFPFREVIVKSGSSIPKPTRSHQTRLDYVQASALAVSGPLSEHGAPASKKSRIKIVSALFEDALRIRRDKSPNF